MKYPFKFQTQHHFWSKCWSLKCLNNIRDLSMKKESSYRSLIETVMDNLVAYKVHESPCKLCVTDQGWEVSPNQLVYCIIFITYNSHNGSLILVMCPYQTEQGEEVRCLWFILPFLGLPGKIITVFSFTHPSVLQIFTKRKRQYPYQR